MQVSSSAPASRPGTGSAQKRKRTLVRDTAATALLSQTPHNQPPSLRDRQYPPNELFHYYAMRGNGEVVCSDSAVQAALSGAADGARATTTTTGGDGRPVSSGFVPTGAWPTDVTGEEKDDAAGAGSAIVLSESGEPLFPRLRPSAVDDSKKNAFVRQAQDLAKRDGLQARKQNLALPAMETYYGALYTPDAPLTNHIRTTMEESVKKKTAESAAAMVGVVAGEGAAMAGGVKGQRAAMDRSARHAPVGSTGLNNSMRSSSLQGGLTSPGLPPQSSRSAAGFSLSGGAGAGGASGRRSPQIDSLDRGSPSATAADASARGFASGRQDEADVQAALLRESHAQTAKEVEDVFVATYYIQHPDARARKAAQMEEESRRRSARAASLAMASTDASAAAARRSTARGGNTSRSNSQKRGSSKNGTKGKKKKTAPPPRRDGAPPDNMRLFLVSLLACADEQGRVTQAQFEALLHDVPFEVTNDEALRELFALVRQFSQAKQREIAFLAAEAAAVPHGYADSSIASTGSGLGHHGSVGKPGNGGGGGGGVAQSMRSLVNMRSGVLPPQAGASARLSIGSRAAAGAAGPITQSLSGADYISHSNSIHGHASGQYGSTAAYPHGSVASGGAVGAVSALAQARPSPVVYLREIVGALDELLNGDDTRDVVRWTCFNVFASSGQGYIHKATLANLRQLHREECEQPQADITASMVKALGDCFDVIAQEEEEAFLNSGKKGKKSKKKKAPALASNQKSAIPLGVMRVSHMNYATFCRFFEALPQVAAAFSHVWIGLLLTGTIGSTMADATGDTTTSPAGPSSASPGEFATVLSAETSPRMGHTSLGASSPPSVGLALSPRLTENNNNNNIDDAQNTSSSAERDLAAAARRVSMASPISVSMPTRQAWPQEIVRGLDGPAPVEPGTFPLRLLGEDSIARRATLQRVIVNRLECMRSGLEEVQNEQQINLAQGRHSM